MAILIHHFRGADMQQTRKAKVDAAYVAKVDAAIQAIQEFFQIGQQLTQKQSHKASYGQDTVGAEAKKYNLNPDTIRKARQFADPVRGYTESEVKELCSLIRTLQTNQRGAIFGRTHLIRLLSVPKQKRGKVQKLAIECRWSMAELESLIASRFGSRRDGGRKRRVPSEVIGVLVQIEGLCESWHRWAEIVTPPESNIKQRGTRDGVELPGKLSELVHATTVAMTTLHRAVTDELKTRNPRRNTRKQYRAENDSK